MLRKIAIRKTAASPIATSAGGADWVTDRTTPSAGETNKPGRVGVTRHGSRKK
jgi:hypothetical protein